MRKPRNRRNEQRRKDGLPRPSHHPATSAAADIPLGTIAGAAIGAVGGPVGLAVGAVVGGAVGAAAARALDRQTAVDDARDAELDAIIGVEDGDLGAPNLKHPPARFGAYSAASAGASGMGAPADDAPDEGPFPRSG